MSVVVTVAAAGTVVVGSKIFAGLTAAAAASMGMRLVAAAERIAAEGEDQELLTSQEIEVSVATEAALGEAVAERCRLELADDQVRMVITRDIRGKVSVTAHSRELSREELSQRAQLLLGRIRQQVAYREVVTRMQRHGFAVSEERALDDGTVRLRLGIEKR